MAPWYENDAQWEATYPTAFSSHKLAAAPGEVARVLELTETPPHGAVLDLCCGPGRHAVELARRGLEVTGVDRTAFLLDKAAARAAEAGVEVELVQHDMRSFVREQAFDLAICLYHSFGYFDDRHDDQRVLASVFRCLKPGGRLLLEATSKEVVARTFAPYSGFEVDGITVVIERAIEDDWNRTRNTSIILRGDRAERHPYHLNLYSGQELKGALARAGFASTVLFGGLDGRPYGPQAEGLLALATRP